MNRETYRRAFDDIPFSDDFETRTIKLLQDRARNQEKEKMTMTFSKHRKLAVTLAAAVAALAALLAPEKEAAVLFVFFGYYPMLRKLIGRLRVRAAAWAVKLVYVNAAVFAAYGLMLYVFHLTAVMEDFAGMGKAMLAVLLVLANVTFVIYDVLIARLEIYYHVRLRPKLHL